ncbi:MAG: hypothetical protein HY901_02275 [Deltaproteobacteria bacterium]|nr:hypothetical protein [Deltaproteobacteria bacterium]
MNPSTKVKIRRVGSSGQISLGKRLAGRYFRFEEQEDGSIVLVPVAVLPKSHWSVRDEGKIKKALAWAAENPLGLAELTGKAGSKDGCMA